VLRVQNCVVLTKRSSILFRRGNCIHFTVNCTEIIDMTRLTRAFDFYLVHWICDEAEPEPTSLVCRELCRPLATQTFLWTQPFSCCRFHPPPGRLDSRKYLSSANIRFYFRIQSVCRLNNIILEKREIFWYGFVDVLLFHKHKRADSCKKSTFTVNIVTMTN